jgi:hypothetical protein
MRASALGELPLEVEKVGGDWKRQQTIDVVGINNADQSLLLGVSLWDQSLAGIGPMHDLITKTPAFVPKEGKWSIFYAGFASGGWSKNAAAFTEQIINREGKGKNWKAVGFKLLDLDQVDTDLGRWNNGYHKPLLNGQ